ncbi:MAG: DUF3362 domain-containing protein, partial [Oscillospiraceae bacterium]|nr:DUF3362 domain-containing protein [Oscillospiraceae bacterium]
MQRALIQYRNPKNYYLVWEALVKAGREDLIGFEKDCLIRPRGVRVPPPRKPAAGKPTGKKPAAAGKSADGKLRTGPHDGRSPLTKPAKRPSRPPKTAPKSAAPTTCGKQPKRGKRSYR